jgi:hypothetical protein
MKLGRTFEAKKTSLATVVIGGCVLLCCIMPALYLTVGRSVEHQQCMHRVAAKHNIAPTRQALYLHLLQLAPAGLPQEEVLNRLGTIGKVTVVNNTLLAGSLKVRQTLRIDVCLHPLNNVILFANYGRDNRLSSLVITDS